MSCRSSVNIYATKELFGFKSVRPCWLIFTGEEHKESGS